MSALPSSLAQIAALIPLSAVMCLTKEFGGAKSYIPKSPGTRTALSKCIGYDAARVLAAVYGGEYIAIPRAARLQRRIRNQEILVAHYSGCPMRRIAKQHGLTVRQVSRILGKVSSRHFMS